MKIEKVKIGVIKPYHKNAKKHPKKQIEQIANSIKEFGFNQPIVVDKKNVIIVGHGRYEALKLLDVEMVEILRVNLPDDKAKAYRIADNRLNESDWEMERLIEELKQFDDDLLELTGFDNKEIEKIENKLDDKKYTKKITPPVYEPKNEKPEIPELFDSSKADDFIRKIEKAKIPDEVKEFLIYSAYRLVVFNYQKIADFYAHSDKDIKDLMEDLALVIIDYDKAIENGYVAMCGELLSIFEEATQDEK